MDEILYVVYPQQVLPKINGVIVIKDMFEATKISQFKVKEMASLDWNEENGLIINLKGYYV